jgi:cell division protease FtsH
MVGLWGMSDDLGPVSYGLGETHPFLGRELAAPREFAEATAARIDAAVTTLLEHAQAQATALLQGYRQALDALAEELVAHESVGARRLEEILIAAGALRAQGSAAAVSSLANELTAPAASAAAAESTRP